MTINDLAFEMVKDKEDTKARRKMEKKIASWEKEKAYPTLDDIYQMAYIIGVNPRGVAGNSKSWEEAVLSRK
ncbi:MAG: hypothetical protein IJ867_06315 [Clostridia bacterium]|nr:hypothetical protein [Clostridia bacterium]